ncbi:TIGR02466 family protein [Arenicella xantha]|uniref:Uncharacterized protein (TIGR02466 family) n=1 Tax=Arenicella xantha TaxID=644221 RepID=A0A395JIE3_9GAMM|nr:TIGR02466 family protein [Arenicella xantha]RBP49795.1 uncharacterized protein (TIGR02466 family) [Arenicella xantha]
MDLNKELFFPTPIYFFDLANSDALNEFLKVRIYSWRDREQAGIERSNVKRVGAWHSPTTMDVLPEFALFKNQIDTFVGMVFDDQRFDPKRPPRCQNMWANMSPQGGYNRSHTHPGSLWSGVYYVQSPPDCGRIIFQDPRPQAHTMSVATDLDASAGFEQWPEVFHQAVAGRVILFPSWLRHEVEANLCRLSGRASDRISISFNYTQSDG